MLLIYLLGVFTSYGLWVFIIWDDGKLEVTTVPMIIFSPILSWFTAITQMIDLACRERSTVIWRKKDD